MSLSINTKTYNPDSYQKDQVSYVGVNNTLSVKDKVVLARTAPKPTAEFSGVGRTMAKLTRTLSLTGALTPTADAIVDVQSQIPVGFTAADVDTLCADMGAWIASSQFKALLKHQLINQ
jgi:hypothetical protein